MNIQNAIRSLQNGQAIRPAGWLGYVERVDVTLELEYDPNSTYNMNAIVSRNGYRYVCLEDGTTGPFDPDKWVRIGNDYYLVFVDKKDATDVDPADTTDNPSAIYRATAHVDGSVSWGREAAGSPIPSEVKAAHGGAWDSKTIPSPVDMPDDELFIALVGDTWESGLASDFEQQRQGGGSGRW